MTADKIGVDDALAEGCTPTDLEAMLVSASPYVEKPNGLFWMKPLKDGPVEVRLTNFTTRIKSDVSIDDGVQRSRSVDVEATLHGRSYRGRLPVADFLSMGWPVEMMGSRAIIEPGFAMRDRARAAIQHVSGKDIADRRVFVHTGWAHDDGANIYLHAGGAIGEHGVVEGIEVELPPQLRRFELPAPPSGADLRKAVRSSLSFLDVAPDRNTVPILGAVYRAPLGDVDFSEHLSGPTSAFKTELAALAEQHFGSEFTSRQLPASWSYTGNSLEELAFLSKDALLVVDDFVPNGGIAETQALQRKAERLFRAQGNRSGRTRMRPDTSLRPARPPRGLILSTGEDVPPGQSLRARIAINQIGRGDVDLDRLTAAQEIARQGMYAQAMAAYLCWMAPKMAGWPAVMREMLASLRASSYRGHGRISDNISNLGIGLEMFVTFALDVAAITADESQAFRTRTWCALRDLAAVQIEEVGTAEPARRFLSLLGSAISAGRAHLAAPSGGVPPSAEAWGWRRRAAGSLGEGWDPSGDCVGWVDGDEAYLDPTAAHRAAQLIGQSSGDPLSVGERTLARRLSEGGWLASTEPRRRRNTVRRDLSGRQRSVLHIRAESFSEVVAKTAIPASDDPHEEGNYLGQPNGWPGRMAADRHSAAANGHHMGHTDAVPDIRGGLDGPIGRSDSGPGCQDSATIDSQNAQAAGRNDST